MTAPDSPGVPASPAVPEAYGRWVMAAVIVNFLLVAVLFYTQAQIRATLIRLDAASARTKSEAALSEKDRHQIVAGRGEQIAFLLAASADAEQTRHLLDALSLGEYVEMARTLLARPAANDRNAALGALFQRIAANDPPNAVALLGAVMEAALKSDLAAKVAASWTEMDPAAAASWLAGDGAPLFSRVPLRRLMSSAVNRWAAFDPAAAAQFVAVNGGSDEQALRGISREWARKDPAAALAWTQGFPAGDQRRPPAIYGVLEGWTEIAPAQAAGYVGQLTFGANRSYAGEAAAVASRWTEREPAAAAQWAVGLPDRTARHDALRQVAASWAKIDAPNAARWAAGLPPSQERAEIWQGVSDYWADADPAGTEAWLSTLPVGGDRDAAVATYAAKVVDMDPEKALTWAKTLSGGSFASQQIQKLLAAWSHKDVMAAQNWAAANQIARDSRNGSR